MSENNRKRGRDQLDEEKDPEVNHPSKRIKLCDDISMTNTIMDAFRSGNDNLFELTCNSLQLNMEKMKINCTKYEKQILLDTYESFDYSVKYKLKFLVFQNQNKTITLNEFRTKFQSLSREISEKNIDTFILFVNDDDTGLYPNQTSYQNKYETKKPRGLHPNLSKLYPTRNDFNSVPKRRIILTMQHELSHKVKGYKHVMDAEFIFRCNLVKESREISNALSAQTIKAKKLFALRECIQNIKLYKTTNTNWNRDVCLRCDDMIEIEFKLNKLVKRCKLNINKIKYRMINVLEIAHLESNTNKIVIKTRKFAFGQDKPTVLFMEYKTNLSKFEMYLEEINEMISELSNLEITNLIGNKTKKKRAKIAQTRRENNKINAQKKAKQDKEKDNDNEQNDNDNEQKEKESKEQNDNDNEQNMNLNDENN